jgi:hypothetical protein
MQTRRVRSRPKKEMQPRIRIGIASSIDPTINLQQPSKAMAHAEFGLNVMAVSNSGIASDEADYEAPTRLLAGGRLSLDRVRS